MSKVINMPAWVVTALDCIGTVVGVLYKAMEIETHLILLIPKP